MGGGNDWINAGSGNDTIYASAASGQSAVIIVGNAGASDRVVMGTASTSIATFDTIIGADTANAHGVGSTTVEVTAGNLLSPPTMVDFQAATLMNLNLLQIDTNATAVFEIVGLTALGASQEPTFVINPATPSDFSSTLKIIADMGAGQTNLVNNANLYGFSGTVDISVTGNGTDLLHPVTTDIMGVTSSQNVIIDQSTTTGWDNINASTYGGTLWVNAGTGVEAMNAGTGLNTVVFSVAGAYADSFVGHGGTYLFNINANVDLTGSTVSGTSTSVTANIASGATLTVLASVVDVNPSSLAGPSGFVVEGGSATSHASLIVQDNVSGFLQNNIAVVGPSYVDETVDAHNAALGVAINLTINPATTNDPASITVIGSNHGDTIQVGTGVEKIGGGNGNDIFNFDQVSTVSGPFVFNHYSVIDGGLGNNTLNVGDSVNGVFVDLTLASVKSVEIFNIGTASNSAQALTNEVQIYNSITTVGKNSQIVINVDGNNPTPHVLSMSQAPIGPIANNSSLTLDFLAGAGSTMPQGAAVIVNADNSGDKINLGYAAAAGPVTEIVYDGAGNDTIATGGLTGETDLIILGAGGVDTLYATMNANVTWQFASRGGATHLGNVAGSDGSMSSFLIASDTIDNLTFGPATQAHVKVSTNTDFSGATFVGAPTDILVDASQNVVLTDTQLTQLNGHSHIASSVGGDTTTGLVIDVTQATFAPLATDQTLGAGGSWTGSVTLVGTGAVGQTFDVTHLATENYGGTGALYIYGGAGNDTAVFNGAEGQHGGVLDLGGGANLLQVTGTTDFSGGGAAVMDIERVGNIHLASNVAGNTATFTYAQLQADAASSGGALTVSSDGGNFNYSMVVNGTGNMNLSDVTDTGLLANIQNHFTATVVINDNNTTSVTVQGTANQEATSHNGYVGSGDIITVNGLGDTVIGGAGSDLINFKNLNVANNYQFRMSDLGTGDASNSSDLAAEGDVIIGLKAHEGYADISGFGTLSPHVATSTLIAGDNLGTKFASYGVVFDGNTLNPFLADHSRTISEQILASGVVTAASDIIHSYVETTTSNQGMVAVWDTQSDVALFYVNHTNGTAALTYNEVKLVGVFDTNGGAATPGAVVLPSTFFHIHAA